MHLGDGLLHAWSWLAWAAPKRNTKSHCIAFSTSAENTEQKLNLTSPMEQTGFASSSQWNLSFMFKQSNRNNLHNANNLFHNVSKEQLPVFIKMMWTASLLIPTDSSKAWNQNSIKQHQPAKQPGQPHQNRKGASNQKCANETIKRFHLQTYDYTIEKNASCHVPLHNERKNLHAAWTMHACMHGNLNWSNNPNIK